MAAAPRSPSISARARRRSTSCRALPAITAPLIIDGTTQPGYSNTPLIELDGAGAGTGANGLTLAGNGITVKGLIISGFGGDGIEVTGNNDLVESNYIGIDSTGNHAMGNGEAGVAIIDGATGNTIGGTAAGSGNVISANAGDGVDDIGCQLQRDRRQLDRHQCHRHRRSGQQPATAFSSAVARPS